MDIQRRCTSGVETLPLRPDGYHDDHGTTIRKRVRLDQYAIVGACTKCNNGNIVWVLWYMLFELFSSVVALMRVAGSGGLQMKNVRNM